MFLILISLNIVAAYEWVLSKIFRLEGKDSVRNTSFDTTHMAKSFRRRVRPLE